MKPKQSLIIILVITLVTLSFQLSNKGLRNSDNLVKAADDSHDTSPATTPAQLFSPQCLLNLRTKFIQNDMNNLRSLQSTFYWKDLPDFGEDFNNKLKIKYKQGSDKTEEQQYEEKGTELAQLAKNFCHAQKEFATLSTNKLPYLAGTLGGRKIVPANCDPERIIFSSQETKLYKSDKLQSMFFKNFTPKSANFKKAFARIMNYIEILKIKETSQKLIINLENNERIKFEENDLKKASALVGTLFKYNEDMTVRAKCSGMLMPDQTASANVPDSNGSDVDVNDYTVKIVTARHCFEKDADEKILFQLSHPDPSKKYQIFTKKINISPEKFEENGLFEAKYFFTGQCIQAKTKKEVMKDWENRGKESESKIDSDYGEFTVSSKILEHVNKNLVIASNSLKSKKGTVKATDLGSETTKLNAIKAFNGYDPKETSTNLHFIYGTLMFDGHYEPVLIPEVSRKASIMDNLDEIKELINTLPERFNKIDQDLKDLDLVERKKDLQQLVKDNEKDEKNFQKLLDKYKKGKEFTKEKDDLKNKIGKAKANIVKYKDNLKHFDVNEEGRLKINSNVRLTRDNLTKKYSEALQNFNIAKDTKEKQEQYAQELKNSLELKKVSYEKTLKTKETEYKKLRQKYKTEKDDLHIKKGLFKKSVDGMTEATKKEILEIQQEIVDVRKKAYEKARSEFKTFNNFMIKLRETIFKTVETPTVGGLSGSPIFECSFLENTVNCNLAGSLFGLNIMDEIHSSSTVLNESMSPAAAKKSVELQNAKK